jgi:hypothetical protein
MTHTHQATGYSSISAQPQGNLSKTLNKKKNKSKPQSPTPGLLLPKVWAGKLTPGTWHQHVGRLGEQSYTTDYNRLLKQGNAYLWDKKVIEIEDVLQSLLRPNLADHCLGERENYYSFV